MTTARRLLVAVADGAPEALDLARELAELGIAARGGRGALDVLRGGDFALLRAVEIAGAVLEGDRADRGKGPPGTRPRGKSGAS